MTSTTTTESDAATSIIYFVKDGKILLLRKPDANWQGIPITGDPSSFNDSNEIFRPDFEIGLVPMHTTKIAEQSYKSESDVTKQHMIHAYVCDEWSGELRPPEGYEAEWFALDEVPYSEMFPDRRYWLPMAFAGTPVEGEHIVGDGGEIVDHSVKPTDTLDDDAPTSQA